LILRFLVPLLAGAALFAQDPSAPPQPPDLKAFLNLSDSQIQALVDLQQQKGQALQPVVQQAVQTPAESFSRPWRLQIRTLPP